MTDSEYRRTGYQVDNATVDDMELDGEAVVLNLDTQGYFGLNPTGTEVWQLLKKHPGVTARTIAENLARRYETDPATIADDVRAVLAELCRESLVLTCPPVEIETAPAAPAGEPYMVPRLEPYGELDTLILSGE